MVETVTHRCAVPGPPGPPIGRDSSKSGGLKRLAGVVGLAVAGCASPPAAPEREASYLERAVPRAGSGVAVTASVLDRQEIAETFGVRLDRVGIQPVWLEIQNLSAYGYVLFLRSIDPDYFSPYEVARRAAQVSDRRTEALYPLMRDQEVERFIPPGAKVEGYVYTHLDEGLKAVTVDLVGNQRVLSFSMVVDVPGLQADYADVSVLLDEDTPKSFDLEGLRGWLEALPCCAVSAGDQPGDPLNLILVGELDAVRAALISQHWDVTEEVTRASVWRTARAFVFGSKYRYAPVSPLYLFGRGQDMSFQKARLAIDERNHIRLWRAPVTYLGTPVWVGHISRDAGIKASGRFWPPTTHVIDPAVDEARFYLEQDILYSQRVEKIGLAEGAGAATADAPRFNAEGDPYFTDGLRAVFFIGNRSVPLDEIEVLPWRLPADLEPFREDIFLAEGDGE
jgi:hypothetical protein